MNNKKNFKQTLAFLFTVITIFAVMPINLFAYDNAGNDTTVQVDGECISLDDKRIQNNVSVQPSRLRSSLPNVSRITAMSGEFAREPNVLMNGTRLSAQRYVVTIDDISYEAFCADPLLKGPENPAAIYALSGEANLQLKNALKNGYPINSEWSDITLEQDDRLWWNYITRVAVAMANNSSRNFTGDSIAMDQARNLANGSIIADANTYPPIMLNGLKEAQDTGRIVYDSTAQSQAFEVTYNRKTNNLYNPFVFEWVSGTPDGAKLIVDGNEIATAPNNPDTIFKDNITSFHIEMPNNAEYAGKTAAVNLVGIHNQFADKIWLLQNPNNSQDWQDIVFYIPEVSASAAFSFTSEEAEPKEAELHIIKQNPSGNGLAGAVFEITGQGGYSKRETSSSNGTIKLTGLTPGEYTVTEISPPAGHQLANPTSKTVTIAPNSNSIVEAVFINEPDNTTQAQTSIKIQKVDALTRENIPGALVRLRGISANVVVTGGTVPSTGDTHWTLNNTGINLSQVLTAGAETVSGEVKSTVSDGVWSLEGLPYGAYIVEEERAPDNYSLLPQHTSYGFWILPPDVTVDVDNVNVIQCPETGEVLETIVDYEIREEDNVSSVLITFENYPFGKIEVTKYDEVTSEPLAGTHFRIQGYFPEGNTNGMPIDRVQVTDGNGKTVFENLPAGEYTISEVEAPPGYQFDSNDHRSISLTWGQTASTTFYNKPKTFVEVIKVDGKDSNKLLDGAIFRLTDPTLGEIWEGTTSGGKVRLGEGKGSFGNQLVDGKLYILTEIQAPPGYVLNSTPIEVIVAADNQLNVITVKNFLKPTLTIIKYDELTNKPLAGATFRLWQTEGETWSENQITDESGKIVWTDLDPGTYSIQEIDEPYGYFKDDNRKEIFLNGGDNKELTFFNRPRPVLTILKRDLVTGDPLANVKFKVYCLEGETIGEFLTDENGMIELSPKTGYLLEEKVYRVTEIQPPDQYLLDIDNTKDIQLKWREPTELVFENILKPTLIFIKQNGLTGRGISNATYKVEFESANGGIVNIGTYKTQCGLIVLPHIQPGWYILTETIPAPGYQLPTNPVQRIYLAPGENSYTYEQTQTNIYVDPRTNPSSGSRGKCGDWCGYLCSKLCAGNCGSSGGGDMSSGNSGGFGDITITNGNGDSLDNGTSTPTNPTKPTLMAGIVTRNSDMTASVQFTSSVAGRYYYVIANSGATEPTIATGGLGSVCKSGSNTITVFMTAGAKDLYIKVKDANGNISDSLKIAIPIYTPSTQSPTEETPPSFDDIVITGGTVVYLNPDFSGITITFGNQ